MAPLLVESWIWWSVVIIVATIRFVSRRLTLGAFRKFQADDYLMMLVLCFYTTVIVTINIVRHTSSNLLPPGFNPDNLTKQDIRERQYGSKLILVVEQCQCATVWGVKGCLIILYMRLTTMRRENIAIKVLAGYVVLTFVVMDILYFGVWCQPFHEYWAVPTPNPQCDAATNHLITNMVGNLSSDLALLAIGLPMFLRMRLPWKKKIPIIGVFSLSIFTILAAILNKVYSFTDPFGAEWTYWYTRESSTAILVANLPFTWTLWRRIFGIDKSIDGTSNGVKQSPTLDDNEVGGDKSPTASINGSANRREDLEMTQNVGGTESRKGRVLSLAEILGADEDMNPASKSGEEPTPFTHPLLFYSREGKDQEGPNSYPQKAVVRDGPERQTVRRSSSLDEVNASEFLTSPELSSKKSAGSFV